MDKRYTVFVSSTFTDLSEARWAVARGLMRLNLIPLGMEAFTASNLNQWDFIKKTIDLSDYYILIIGNRYGSIDPESGISYTEKEYRYALEQGIPCLAFLSENIPLPPKYIESDEHREKLSAFRSLASRARMVDSWTNPDDLTLKAATAMVGAQIDSPRPGWVRNPQSSPEVAEQLARLIRENAELKHNSISDATTNLVEVLSGEFTVVGNTRVSLFDIYKLLGQELALESKKIYELSKAVRTRYLGQSTPETVGMMVQDCIRKFVMLDLIDYEVIAKDRKETSVMVLKALDMDRPVAYYRLTGNGRQVLKYVLLNKISQES